jgi:hypothetical protein
MDESILDRGTTENSMEEAHSLHKTANPRKESGSAARESDGLMLNLRFDTIVNEM